MKPIVYKVQKIRDGRSFANRFVTGYQDGRIIFSIQISFYVKEETAISHECVMPKIEGPEHLKNEWEFAEECLKKIQTGEIEVLPHAIVNFEIKLKAKGVTIIEVSC